MDGDVRVVRARRGDDAPARQQSADFAHDARLGAAHLARAEHLDAGRVIEQQRQAPAHDVAAEHARVACTPGARRSRAAADGESPSGSKRQPATATTLPGKPSTGNATKAAEPGRTASGGSTSMVSEVEASTRRQNHAGNSTRASGLDAGIPTRSTGTMTIVESATAGPSPRGSRPAGRPTPSGSTPNAPPLPSRPATGRAPRGRVEHVDHARGALDERALEAVLHRLDGCQERVLEQRIVRLQELEELRRRAAPAGRLARARGRGVGAALDLALQRLRREVGRVVAVLERRLLEEARDVARLEDAEPGEKQHGQPDAEHGNGDEPAANRRARRIEERCEAASHGGYETSAAGRGPASLVGGAGCLSAGPG